MGSERDVESDLALLIDCLKFQQGSEGAQKQALQTVATICSENENAKDYLRQSGGLHQLLDLLFQSTDCIIQSVIMFALGCAAEKNASSQSVLCTTELFEFIRNLLCDEQRAPDSQTAAAFLVGVTVSGSDLGQTMVRDSGVLACLIDTARSLSSNLVLQNSESALRLWKSVMAALTNCMSNPHNEENQRISSQALPAILAVLSQPVNSVLICHSASFIAACCSTNERNQMRLNLVGGLDCLLAATKRFVSANYSSNYSLVSSLLNALTSAVAGNARNCQFVCNHGFIPLLAQLLGMEADEQFQLQVVLAVGYCTEECEDARKAFVAAGGLGLVVEHLGPPKSEQLKRAVTYVLQSCLQSSEDDSALRYILGRGDTVSSLLPALLKGYSFRDAHQLQTDDAREVFQSPEHQKSKKTSMFSTLSAQTYDRAEPDASSLHSSRQDAVNTGLRPLSSAKCTPRWKPMSAHRVGGSYSKLPNFATPFRLPTLLTVPTSPSRAMRRLPVTPIRPVSRTTNLRMTPIARTSTPKPCKPAWKALQLSCPLGSIFSTPSPHSPLLSMEETVHVPMRDLDPCPACTPQYDGPMLDSRNFVSILRSSRYTCPDHAQMIEDHIVMAKQLREDPTVVQSSLCTRKRSHNVSIYDFPLDLQEDCFKSPSKPFTNVEIQNLNRGVRVFGKRWQVILNAFDFHRSRTAAQLKDKHRQFESNDGVKSTPRRRMPFTEEEEERLCLAVSQYGHQWSLIRRDFQFGSHRTSADLRDKWRNMKKAFVKVD